jgi:hypothetical protein
MAGMEVKFMRSGATVATVDMSAVPRSGEGVEIEDEGWQLVVWNVTWDLRRPAAFVHLVSRQEYEWAGGKP